MYDRLSAALMRWLRVPPRPEPPLGAPGSERVFRAGRNAFRLSLALWGLKQGMALVGLLFGLWVLGEMKGMKHATASLPTEATASPSGDRVRKNRGSEAPRVLVSKWVRKTPDLAFGLLTVLEGISVLTFLAQIPLTYALRRMEYEQRWYIVTDRSLRLRSGVWKVQEVTMSFANLQQITVTQGPLQRALGLADVRVQSAGGGGGGSAEVAAHGRGENPSHRGCFRAVDNAEEIRDLITERLRQFRESGLGDPEEARPRLSPELILAMPAATIDAARELLTEARALREAAHRSLR